MEKNWGKISQIRGIEKGWNDSMKILNSNEDAYILF